MPATGEAEIKRAEIRGSPGQKVHKTPSQSIKAGMVAHACHPSNGRPEVGGSQSV
jgi:hypothetical protein